jgi:TonB family protein
MSEETSTQPQHDPGWREAPALHYELEPGHRVFWSNFSDLIARREPPPLETTSQPVPVPPETFIRTGLGFRHIVESYGYHALLIVLIYFFSTSSFFNRPVELHSPFENTKVENYPLSEYLPPLNTGPRGEAKPRKGAPKLAKQEILSVPANPDNNHQTIVTPPKVKLDHDVPLPNIVAWTQIPGQPIAASSRQLSQLKMPQFVPQVVEPTADVSKLKSKTQMPLMAQQTVVEPTADVSKMKSKLQMPVMAQPSVVEPPLSPDQLKLKRGEINMAQMAPQVDAPKLPVPTQRAAGVGDSAGAADSAGKGIPAQPSMQGLQTSKGQGQIIALGLSPADVRGPIEVPAGNRSGEFHASPAGKPDAQGSPNITGTPGATNGGAGGGKGNGSGNGNGNGSAPAGISVGAPPPGAATTAVTGMPTKSSSDAQMEERKKLVAAAMRPSVPSLSRPPVAPPPPTMSDNGEDELERQVFGPKKYYSLTLNMPNLTSATGSWIVRFAELAQSDNKVAIAAPVAISKFDPAYPAEVMRDNVEGTVTLYAVIHADGTVSGVKVLNSVDPRLDEAAVHALSRWLFRPGTKAGEPVELEAVVMIPFRKHHPAR